MIKTLLLLPAVAILLLTAGCERAPQMGLDCDVVLQPEDSLQAALDEAPSGAVICLAQGTWNEHVVIRRPVTLRGQGAERTTIQATEYLQSVIRVEDAGQVMLEGLTVVGGHRGHVGDDDPGVGVLVVGDSQVEVKRSHLSSNSPSGILVREGGRATVIDSSLSGNRRYGAVVQGPAELVLEGVTVKGNPMVGLWVAGDASIEASDTVFAENGGDGVWLRGDSVAEFYRVQFDENKGSGLRLQDQARVVLEDCSLVKSWDHGLLLEDDAQATVNNTVIRENWDGITLRGNTQAVVEGSEITENDWDGVGLSGGSRIELRGNLIAEGKTGVALTGGAMAQLVDNEIRGFSVAGVSSFGIGVEGSGNRMSDNAVDLWGNVQSGVRAPLGEEEHDEVVFPDEAYPTLQHAVDAVVAGGVLTISSGEHRGHAVVDKELEIRGEEGAELRAERDGPPVFTLVGRADVRLSGLVIRGLAEVIAAGADARIEVVDCELREGSTGFLLWNNAELIVRRTLLEGIADAGILGSSGTSILADNVTFADIGSRGIRVSDTATLEVSGSSLDSIGTALSVSGRSNALISGTRVTDSGAGLVVEGGAQATVEDSSFSANRADGVLIRQLARAAISGSEVRDNGGDGIQLRNAARAEIEHSTIAGNGRYGVALIDPGFTGEVAGKGNTIPGPDEPDGNEVGAMLPEELSFLLAEDGGAFGGSE